MNPAKAGFFDLYTWVSYIYIYGCASWVFCMSYIWAALLNNLTVSIILDLLSSGFAGVHAI